MAQQVSAKVAKCQLATQPVLSFFTGVTGSDDITFRSRWLQIHELWMHCAWHSPCIYPRLFGGRSGPPGTSDLGGTVGFGRQESQVENLGREDGPGMDHQ